MPVALRVAHRLPIHRNLPDDHGRSGQLGLGLSSDTNSTSKRQPTMGGQPAAAPTTTPPAGQGNMDTTPMPTPMAAGGAAVPNTAEPQMPTMPSRTAAMWAACPTTNHQPQAGNIYALKSGATVADEQLVSVEGVVTARRLNPDGLYSHLVLQVNPNASDYNGTDHSGIWVYLNGTDDEALQENPPAEGALVRVHARTDTFFDQRQLGAVVCIEMIQENAGLPAPVDVQANEVGSGAEAMASLMGRGQALEGVLVRVSNSTVTNTEPAVGPGDGRLPDSDEIGPTYEFVVDDRLRVNDFIHRVNPMPMVGARYTAITGILRWGNANIKLEPRRASDLQ